VIQFKTSSITVLAAAIWVKLVYVIRGALKMTDTKMTDYQNSKLWNCRTWNCKTWQISLYCCFFQSQ